ncbi:unnamed protein product [Ectocarpus sp. CCAP 1310/34]|nr:unnamed protein product [Ectocarpus sp. CCAP 1310/34]
MTPRSSTASPSPPAARFACFGGGIRTVIFNEPPALLLVLLLPPLMLRVFV